MGRTQDGEQDRLVSDAVDEPRVEEHVIPVAEEQLRTGKVQHKTQVTISKSVEEENELVTIPYFSEEVEVEHVPVNRVVQEMPEVRREGDTMIVPVVEEEVVVSRQLKLKEELHIHLTRNELEHKEAVRLRRERVDVKRVDLEDDLEAGDA